MASASTSTSSSVFPRNYHVFINHRGPDVKKTFVSHLYFRLRSHGLQVFLDQPELERGENIPEQIEQAIDIASVHVAIFSPRYAESKWCLDELVLMLKSRATRRATIIPVFYGVEPFVLRLRGKDDEVYAEAMRIHEKKNRYDQQIITDWKRALYEVSLISGFELKAYNGDEGELVDEVARQVLKKVRKEPLPVATHPTGLDVKLQDFEVILERQQHREGPNVVGIVGLGGVGKTTLAKYFFNSKTSDYQQSCFLPDVRDAAARHSLTSLQSKLFRDLTGRDQSIDNVVDGIAKLKDRLSCRQALVILDDVDDVVQLDALFSPVKDALPSGSVVLLTSRNKDVLRKYARIAESSIYNMTGLGFEHSLELFCSHAFLQPHPAVGYKDLVIKFLYACQGLPLSLQVFGALLYSENREVWEAQLLKLSQVLPEKIQSRLKISYDSLDKQEKEIFLDIACFFIGTDRDTAIRVWDGSGWVGSLSLMTLQSKCLVTLDRENRIRMHDHLRDLGRDLAENEPPGCPRRLWRPADDLFRNVPPQSTVRGISLDHPFGVYFQSNSIVEMSRVRLLRGPLDSCESQSIMKAMKHSDLLWLHNKYWSEDEGSQDEGSQNERSQDEDEGSQDERSQDERPLDVFDLMDAFRIPINNLRVLQLGGPNHVHQGRDYSTKLWNDESEAPRELRELTIHLHLHGLPKSIGQLQYLEKIELSFFGGTSLPEEFFHLRSLKHLTIISSGDGASTLMLPDSLGNLTNLQHIDLSNFNFQTLPSSFGNLTKLQHVSLQGCFRLTMLPGSFKNLIRLKHLNLSSCHRLTLSGETLGNISTLERLSLEHCSQIEELPPQVTHQQSLQELILNGTTLKELPSTIEDLGNLEILEIGCSWLEILPASLGNLTSLKKLRLFKCDKLKSLPDSVGKLKQLTSLRIYHSAIRNLPVGVRELNNLIKMTVKNCPIRGVPFASGRSLDSSIHRCMLQLRSLTMWSTSITEISFGEGVCPVLQHLDLRDSPRLVEVGALPTTLISLNVWGCDALKRITGLRGRGQTKLIIESNKVLQETQVSYTGGPDTSNRKWYDDDTDTSDDELFDE